MKLDFSHLTDLAVTAISEARGMVLIVIIILAILGIINNKKEKQHGKRKQSNSIRQFRRST
jgi:hypothetical protein